MLLEGSCIYPYTGLDIGFILPTYAALIYIECDVQALRNDFQEDYKDTALAGPTP
jgi:hypothetical protein